MKLAEARALRQRDGLFDSPGFPPARLYPWPMYLQSRDSTSSHNRGIKQGSDTSPSAEKLAFIFSKIRNCSSKKGKNIKQGCQSQASDKCNAVETSLSFQCLLPLSQSHLLYIYTRMLSQALRCKLQQAEGSLKNKERLREDLKDGFGKGSLNSLGEGRPLCRGEQG